MDGMRALLASHPHPDLVIGLDTLGSGRPVVLEAEGVLLDHRYPALVEGERRRLGGWTDPVLATFAGIPAVSILSLGEDGLIPNYHRPTDVPEHVDLASVEACLDVARRAIGR